MIQTGFCVRLLFVVCLVLNIVISVFLIFEIKRNAGRNNAVGKDLEPMLKIYFINLDKSSKRRRSFEKQISSLPYHFLTKISYHRVSAICNTTVNKMLARGILKLNCIKSANEIVEAPYSLSEVACTLSHLKAILHAYRDGVESALVVEDDAILTTEFLENWRAYTKLAPNDWKVLQWSTNNVDVNRKEVHRSNDFWVSWSGHHWSTIAYTIRRDGMKRVLNHTSNIFSKMKEPLQWKFDEPGMIVADELIYFLAGNTYTSSHCWITPRKLPSTMMDHGHKSWIEFGQSKYVPKANRIKHVERSESIAVVESIRLRSLNEVKNEISGLNADIHVLKQFNPHTRWFVQVVLTNYDLLPSFQKQASKLARVNIKLQVKVSKVPFNKFVFVNECLSYISKYHYLLLKDNDIRLAGFEWNTFLNKKNASIISAPFLIGTEGLTDRKKRSISLSKNATNYKIGLQDALVFNPYRSKTFQRIETKPAMMLEMFMVLMRSDFAIWFFRKILTFEFLSQDADWGPDLMWCAAALDFQIRDASFVNVVGKSFPCCLVSVNVKHVDTKQIKKSHNYVDVGKQAIKIFRKSSTTKRWVKTNTRSRVLYHHFWKWCKINSKRKDMIGCLKDYHRVKIEEYSIFLNNSTKLSFL